MLQYLSCLVYDDINCIEMRTIVMNEKVLQTLEYNKIIEQLVTYAASPSGREACRTLKPQTDSRWIETAQRETSDALTHILTKGELSFYGIEDIRPALKRLEIGSSLGSHELLDIAKLLSAPFFLNYHNRKKAGIAPASTIRYTPATGEGARSLSVSSRSEPAYRRRHTATPHPGTTSLHACR